MSDPANKPLACKLTRHRPDPAALAYPVIFALILTQLFILPLVADAATTITTLSHTNAEVAVGLPHQRKVVRDSGGYWYVTYMDDVGSGWEVFLVRSTNTDGTGWATPVKLAGSSGILYNTTSDFYGPAVEIDRQSDVLHIVFVRSGTAGIQSLIYSKCTNLANWNQASSWYRVDGTTNGYDTVATDAYALATNGSHWPSIAVDSNGGAHILYMQSSSRYPSSYHQDGTAWGARLQLTTATVTKAYPAVEVDSNDTVHAFWSQQNGGIYTQVLHRQNDPPYYVPGWDTTASAKIATTGNNLIYPSAAADDDGNVQLLCENDGLSEIWGAHYDGASWTEMEGIDTLGWDKPMVGAKLGYNITDDVIISPDSGTDPDALYYWQWDGSAYGQPETDTGETSDSYVSVEKKAPYGQTAMGYIIFDTSTSQLKFARITGLTAGGPPPIPSYDTTYDFDDSGTAGNGWIWRNEDGTTGLQISPTNRKWSYFTGSTGSGNTGPTGPQAGAGYVYTEASGSTVPGTWEMELETGVDGTQHVPNVSFYRSMDVSATPGTLYLDVYNGTSWDSAVQSWAGSATDYAWHQDTVSLSAYTNADVKIRFRYVSAGTSFENDVGIDTVRIYSTPRQEIDLGEHASGQLSDQFADQAGYTSANLFRFQFDNTEALDVEVDQITFQLTNVAGMVSGDLTSLRINDGTSDVSTGGVADISGDTGTVTFSGNFTVSGNTTENYTLIGNVSNLEPGDGLTIGVATSDVAVVAGQVGGTSPTDAAHETDWPFQATVSAGNDDSYADEQNDNAATYLSANYVSSDRNIAGSVSKYNGGFRFSGITIPRYATINNAIVSVYVYNASYDNPYLTIYGNLTPDAADFATTTAIYARPRTTAGTVWQESSATVGWHEKDVTAVVQEIVNQGGWSSGNALALLFISDDGTYNPAAFWSYDGDPSRAAKLSIDWTPTPVILGDHSSGQTSDQFGEQSSASEILFRFSLIGDDSTQVDSLDISYTTADGIADGDVTSAMLYADDGTTPKQIDGSDTLIQSGVNGSSGKLSFTTNFTPSSGGTDYLVKVTVSNIASGDSTTFSMGTGDITLSDGAAGGSSPVDVTHEYGNWTAFASANTYNWEVPQGVTSITVKSWGGGAGGGGGGTSGVGGDGGGGGFSQATLAVTPGETLTVYVGGGGGGGLHNGYAAGYSGQGGGGGGYSGLYRSSTELILAGGGGGGGGGDNSVATPGGAGGVGGGTTAGTGGSSSQANGGTGGSDSAAGTGGTSGAYNSGSDGSSHSGGAGADGRASEGADGGGPAGGANGGGAGGNDDVEGNGYGAGGGAGGGWYGGGGGGASVSGDAGGGGGGGGSCYVTGTDTGVGQASGSNAANNTDGDYVAPAGQGGTGGAVAGDGAAGSDGLVVILYTPTGLTLGEHASGQLSDQFDGSVSHTDAALFRFQLANISGSDQTVDEIVFQLTGVSGIDAVDLSTLRINDGTSDVSTGGSPSISAPTGTITFTGNFVVSSGATKNYTLIGDVDALADDDTVTISLAAGDITLLDAGAVGGSAPTNATHTADDTVLLGEHGSGQLSDQFDASSSQNDADLFRFQLVNNAGSAVTIDLVVIQLTAVQGIDTGDLGDLRINDGTSDVSTGGVASIGAPTGTITFDGDFVIGSGATVNYTVRGDVSNLASADTLTLDVGAGNISLGAGSVGGTSPTDATHTTDFTVTLAQHGSGQLADQFDYLPSHNDGDLFRFQMTNQTGGDITVDQIVFGLSAVSGILTGDLSDLRINDGSTDVATGGTPAIGGTTGTITFTGDFVIPGSTTVNYTLRGDSAALVGSDTLTISLSPGGVQLASGAAGGASPTDATHTADHAATLAAHGSGQLTDQLDGAGTQTDVGLFRFRLTNIAGTGLTVDSVTFDLSSVSGILTGDLSSLVIYDDTNAQNASTAGTPAIAGTTGTITFNNDFALASGASVDYTLRGDLTNLVNADTLAIALTAANVTLAAGTVNGSSPANAAHTADHAVLLDEHASGQLDDQLGGLATQTSVDLFRFQLENTTAGDVTVDQLVFQLSAVSGIAGADLGNLKINDGTSDVATGGSPSISAPTGTVAFAANFVVPAGTTKNYTLIGDLVNLVTDDTLTVDLGTSDITLGAGSVGGSDPTSVAHTTDPPLFPLLAYSEYGSAVNNNVYYSEYVSADWSTGALVGTDPNGDWDQLQKVARVSPDSTKIAVGWKNYYASGGRDDAMVSVWDGTSWTDGAGGGPVRDLGNYPVQKIGRRPMDAAFMQDSGKLLVVTGYGSVAEVIHSYIWNGSDTWETGTSYVRTSILTYGTGELVNWVKLSSRPGTDEVVLIASLVNNTDTTASVRVAVWDGDTGTSNIFAGGTVQGSYSDIGRFANSTAVRYQTEAIDVQHVLGGTNEGDAVAVWGEGQYVYARIYRYDTGSWDSRVTVWDSGSGNTIKWLRLKPQPDGDNLILAVGANVSATDGLYTIAYDGNTRSWGTISSAHTSAPYGNSDNNRPFDVIWDPGSGADNLLMVYSDTTGLRYKTSGNGGGSWNSQQTLSSSYMAYWVQLERDPNDDTVHLAIHDGDDDLNTWTWAGASWTFENEISTDLEQSTSRSAEVIALAAYSTGGGGGSGNSSPSLNIDEPDGTGDTVALGTNYDIQYDLSDLDDEVTVAFYYDTDDSGLDGTAISGACASAAEGTSVTCTWDTTGMAPGTYYVYGIVDDGTNPEVSDYSSGQISINTAIYYSVGTSTAALYSGNASASSGTLTLAVAADDRIGVGDEVRVGSDRYYITGRNSSTEFTIQDSAANGGTPGSTAITFGSQSISIYRAFSSLSAAQSGSSDTSHLNATDLVAGGFQLNWACYDDGPDTSLTTIENWTTGASNYIRIFTPTASTQVGVSQRHAGVAGTGYRIAPVNATQQTYNIIYLKTEYVRIEGIEIDGAGLTNAEWVRGILVMMGMTNVGDIRVDSCIIHDLATNAGAYQYEGTMGILDQQQAAATGPPMLIANNIIYDIANNINVGHVGGIHIGSRTTSYVYNNTVYNIDNEGPSGGGPAWGIYAKAWQTGGGGSATVIAKNNYVGDITAPYDSVHYCYDARDGGILTQSYNVASDTTASGTGSIDNMSAYTSYFVSITDGSEDLRLIDTAANLWGGSGEDLSGDFTVDIEGETRSAPWDIGADEFGLHVGQAHYRWREDNGSESGSVVPTVVSASSGSVENDTTITFQHTVSGSNRLLLVGTTCKPGGVSVSSVTWNGTPLTFESVSAYTTYLRNEIWKMVAPAEGTYNIQVTYSSAVYATAGAVTFNNVHQTTPLGTAASCRTLGASPGCAIGSSPGDKVFGVCSVDVQDQTARDADTLHWNTNPASGYYEGVTTAANSSSTSLGWTLGASDRYNILGIAVKGISGTVEWAVGEDKKIGISKLEHKRLRFLVANAGADATVSLELEVAEASDCSSGIYYTIGGAGAGGHWDLVDSVSFTDNDATTNNSGLTDPGGFTFVSGSMQDASYYTPDISINNHQFTEVEFSIQPNANATSGGDYCFRLTDYYGTSFTNYSYAEAEVLGATAVDLLLFSAEGSGTAVDIFWQTAQEAANKGFNLYRGESKDGPWTKLNPALIPAASISGEGVSYGFTDAGVVYGRLYYYKLEDVEVTGAVKTHGPICVDWDADGMADDWEIANGLNPLVDNALFDNDGDGVSNIDEYKRGTDPTDPDTDGDGVLDGAEVKEQDYEPGRTRATAGVDVISQNASGITLELATEGFDFVEWRVGPQSYERLAVHDYIHGYTEEPGWPLVPVKGLLVDVPEGKAARLTVLEESTRVHAGYQLYPVPTHQLVENGELREVFFYNQAAYGADAYFPAAAAALGDSYAFGGTRKQRLIFHPLSFNPVSGDLMLRSKIRVRIDFVDAQVAAAASPKVTPWSPPAFAKGYGAASPAIFAAGADPRRQAHARSLTDAWFGAVGKKIGRPRLPSSTLSGFFPGFTLSFAGLPISLWTIPDFGANYKILVQTEGLYQITRDWLASQGLGEAQIDAIDLSCVSMYYLGEPIAIEVHDADADRVLDAEDHIRFYGQAPAGAYSKYAKYNVYWLCAGGSAVRMAPIEATPGAAPDPAPHTVTVHHELEQSYLMAGRGEDGIDRWVFSTVAFGDRMAHADAGKPRDFIIPLAGVTGGNRGDLTIRMYSPYEGDHTATVAVNGVAVGTSSWSGIRYHTAAFEEVALLPGDNTISVACTSGEDKILFDWFDVTYRRSYAADGDTLKFAYTTGHQFALSGFTADTVAAYDITDPAAVRTISNAAIAGTGPYTYTFEPPNDAATHQYLALATAQLQTPHELQTARSDHMFLASGDNHADWIVITHRELGWDENADPLPWLADLMTHRESQGLRAAAVDVIDIYDEFSYGITSPQAVKDFIAYACESWQAPAPRYVLLVGDASYDVKDNWQVGTVTHVPSYLTFTTYLGETATDQWYVQVAGADALPDLAVGRLPARSAAEAQDMVGKIIAYESATNSKSWEKAVLLVADNRTEDYESVFETVNEDAAATLPPSMDTPSRFYLQEYTQELLSVEDLTADLVNAVNTGALVLNYAGHAAYSTWAAERIWDNRGFANREDCELLANTDKYPLVVSMSCMAGYFVYPEPWTTLYGHNYHSLAEGFIRPAGHGAVAAFMPTGMSTTGGQHILNAALFEEIFTNDIRTLGDAILQARLTLLANTAAAYQEISDTFLLFGDPATGLKLPLPRRPQGLAAARAPEGGNRLAWQTAVDADGNPVSGYNLYRRAASESSFTRLNTGLIEDLAFTDSTADPNTLYYYAVASVDGDSDESPRSIAVTPAAPSSSTRDTAHPAACFVAASSTSPAPQAGMLLLFLLACLAAACGRGSYRPGEGRKEGCRAEGL